MEERGRRRKGGEEDMERRGDSQHATLHVSPSIQRKGQGERREEYFVPLPSKDCPMRLNGRKDRIGEGRTRVTPLRRLPCESPHA